MVPVHSNSYGSDLARVFPEPGHESQPFSQTWLVTGGDSMSVSNFDYFRGQNFHQAQVQNLLASLRKDGTSIGLSLTGQVQLAVSVYYTLWRA